MNGGARPGVVYLVGAGPGDPGLLTARALALIAAADAIFHDRLIPPEALAGARPDAQLTYVGKSPAADGPKTEHIGGKSAHRQRSVGQSEINGRLVEAARAGGVVVRLKGGDPFVFGRGGEEGEALRAAGVEFEVVPGVTAGVAASAYAGIPVTHRDDASAVAFVTGQPAGEGAPPETTPGGTGRQGEGAGSTQPVAGEETHRNDRTGAEAAGRGEGPVGAAALDWEALARFPGTLVFYMGVRRLGENAAALIAAGRDPEEPAAAIERGTLPGQRTVVATLATIAAAAEREAIRAPALIVVGAVVARREQLAWLERRPLHGRRVVVTRARVQVSGLATQLRGLGAEVVELPAIRIEPRIESAEVRRAVERIGEYALICVTSPNGAHMLFEALAQAGLDARALRGPEKKQVRAGGSMGTEGTVIAAMGPSTARALAEHGVRADVVPERLAAEGLVEALAEIEVAGRPVLIARAAEGRDVLPEALRARGAEVSVVALYETVREAPDPAAVEAAQGADYVTFTSSSTVRNLTEALGERVPPTARVVSIGPTTSEAARAAGLEVAAEADPHNIDGLIAALLQDAAS